MTQTSKNRIKLLIPILICLIGMAGILFMGMSHYRQSSFAHISNLCQAIIESHPEAEEVVLSSLKEYHEDTTQGQMESLAKSGRDYKQILIKLYGSRGAKQITKYMIK